MMLDDDSLLIPYQIGDVFVSHTQEETQEMLEAAKVAFKKNFLHHFHNLQARNHQWKTLIRSKSSSWSVVEENLAYKDRCGTAFDEKLVSRLLWNTRKYLKNDLKQHNVKVSACTTNKSWSFL